MEISRQLAAKGILVLMGARDRERGEKSVANLRAQGLPVEFIQIDVTSQPSVDQGAAEVERRHGRLDILVNNAGIALDWVPCSELTVETLQKTYETNVFGVFRVTKALLPLLKKSKHGRIVNSEFQVAFHISGACRSHRMHEIEGRFTTLKPARDRLLVAQIQLRYL